MAKLKIRFTWITAQNDRTEHAVSDDAYEASLAAGTGKFEALCGAEFLAASMDVGPDERCVLCTGFVRARNTLLDLDERLAGDHRPGWLSWLSCVSRPRGRHAA